MANLKKEIDKIKAKEAQEGGLTPGQAATLVRAAGGGGAGGLEVCCAFGAQPKTAPQMRPAICKVCEAPTLFVIPQPAPSKQTNKQTHDHPQVRNERAMDALAAELEDLDEEMGDSVAAAVKGRAAAAAVGDKGKARTGGAAGLAGPSEGCALPRLGTPRRGASRGGLDGGRN
jgi:hypothetical protein